MEACPENQSDNLSLQVYQAFAVPAENAVFKGCHSAAIFCPLDLYPEKLFVPS